MRLVAKLLGVAALACVAAATTVLVMTDDNVRAKVKTAAGAIKDAALEIKKSVEDGVAMAKQESKMSPTERNQAWVDEQWEALGI